jgi:hypothetical protein
VDISFPVLPCSSHSILQVKFVYENFAKESDNFGRILKYLGFAEEKMKYF